MRRKKGNISTIILIVLLLVGISLLLYPTVSDYWNSFHQSRAIASYADTVAEVEEVDYSRYWNEAAEYNQELAKTGQRWITTEEETEQYENILNIGGNGIIGYIEIPAIEVSLPIYHGTDEAVLQIAVGHIEGTAFPVGGASSHCVVSGHRGLPSAKLFTNLDELVEGDIFIMRVLDETLTYEVDQVRIVEPTDISCLEIVEGEDLCTLVTCTPYGINSHRLLVRGHRIENLDEASSVLVTSDAQQIAPRIVAIIVFIPLSILFLICILLFYRKR